MTVELDIPSTLESLEQARENSAVYEALKILLLNANGKTLMVERFRALFTLKALNTHKAIDIIGSAFSDRSSLLKHELAYVLGQMKDTYAVGILTQVLENKQEDSMVRHEAAEALGAIGTSDLIPLLILYRDDINEPDVVRETCELAVDRINWVLEQQKAKWNRLHGTSEDTGVSHYMSIDPAPPLPIEEDTNVSALRNILLDPKKSLFHRYRAMFSLRNIGTEEAVLALADGFNDTSALFRHEIAFVFGQLQHPASVPSLIQVLENVNEAGMVRHEAAEALGSVGTSECLPILQRFAESSTHSSPHQRAAEEEDVVRESCQVGIGMWNYENGEVTQHIDGLIKA